MQTILDILIFIAVLLLLIGFHEFGHLLVGKLAKIPVERYSIGFGPAIIKWKMSWGGETTYQLSVIPLGGYVKFKGEDFDDPEGFFAFPFWRKTAATAGGILANFVLAALIYFIIGVGWGIESPPPVLDFPESSEFSRAGFQSGDSVVAVEGTRVSDFYDFIRLISVEDTAKVSVMRGEERIKLPLPPQDSLEAQPRLEAEIGRVISGSPADEAGLKKGARIIRVEGEPVKSWNKLLERIQSADTNQALQFTWVYKKDTFSAPIAKEKLDITDSYGIGVLVNIPSRSLSFPEALWLPVRRTGEMTAQIAVLLARLVAGKESARNLGGVILIATLSAQSRRWGFKHLLGLLAYLSISLAIINFLPIPALDGGRILMFAAEKVSGRRFGKKVWTIAINIGFILLILLIAFTLFNDIFRLINGG